MKRMHYTSTPIYNVVGESNDNPFSFAKQHLTVLESTVCVLQYEYKLILSI